MRSAGKECDWLCAWRGNLLFCLFIVPCLQFFFFLPFFFVHCVSVVFCDVISVSIAGDN